MIRDLMIGKHIVRYLIRSQDIYILRVWHQKENCLQQTYPEGLPEGLGFFALSIEQGISSISLNPDSVIETWLYLAVSQPE